MLSRREFLKDGVVFLGGILCPNFTDQNFEGNKVRDFLTNKDLLSKFIVLQKDAPTANYCGISTVATSFNLFEHLYGKNRMTSIKNIVEKFILINQNKYFDEVSRKQRAFTQWDGQMYFYDLLNLYKHLGFEIKPIFGTEFEDVNRGQLMGFPQTNDIFPEIKKVFADGGFLVVFSTVYNGHFYIATDFKPKIDEYGNVTDLELFILDGKGKDGNGMIGKIKTCEYSPYYAYYKDKKYLTTGIIGIAGILPGDLMKIESILM